MTKNVGNTDKLVRYGIALVALVGAYLAGFSGVTGVLLLILAAVLAVTAVVGFCPIYRVLGMSTCKTS
ncbi:MAG TPA: DUF2892 domain-containing protein [Propionibacteriaceae bacterium]|nr:DUF2892 domain-containing protein [Propionibacteriaceae bacterium]